MTKQQRFWAAAVVAAGCTVGSTAHAQECGIRSLGGSTRFADPVDSIVELQSVFTTHWSEISRLLGEARWPGDPDDLREAVARGRVTSQSFAPGTQIEWMMMRKRGVPTLVRNDCWGGAHAFGAYAFDVESNGRRWFFAVPKECANLALLGSEPASRAAAETAPARPAPTPPEPATAHTPSPSAPPETPSLYVSPRPPWNAEILAGYFFPEELDEDLTFGARLGYRTAYDWGWMLAVSWFDVADSQGFRGRRVDADLVHVDFSAVYFPGGNQRFSIFFGPGWVTGNVDVPRTTRDFSDDAFTVHAGMGYEFDVTRIFYIKPDVRLRYYELEGWGADGGRETQITYEAAVALGWRFGS